MKIKELNCWIVCEEHLIGTKNQCLGIAEALGVKPKFISPILKQPWKSLSPYLGFESSWCFANPMSPPWPDLVIAGGRKSIAASKYIKRASGGKCFTVQVQDPRISSRHFDLVAAPAHDPIRGSNVIQTQATPNRISKEILEEARAQFATFEKLPQPRVAVLIGGSSKAYTLTHDIMTKLSLHLSRLKDVSLMITTSRRTGAENEQILKDHINMDKHFLWDGHDPNPYFGILAFADFILVTADSASMLSEACTTGKPVYMIHLDGGHPRIDKLHQNLQELGCIRKFEGQLEHWDYEALNDAAMVAQEIKKRIKINE